MWRVFSEVPYIHLQDAITYLNVKHQSQPGITKKNALCPTRSVPVYYDIEIFRMFEAANEVNMSFEISLICHFFYYLMANLLNS